MRNRWGSDTRTGLYLLALTCGLAAIAFPQKKKEKEVTQVLQLPKELPAAIEAETHRLAFHVTPLSNKGLLSKQVKDAIGILNREAKGGTIVHIRAFVAGSGDSRRVRDIVSEEYTDKHAPLPVLSLVQSGGLPDNAQVVLEGISVQKKDVNPNGLGLISAQVDSGDDPAGPVAPLATKALGSLRTAVKAAGTEAADILRVTCFLSSLDEMGAIRKLVTDEYPAAEINIVQTQRAPIRNLAAMEAVVRLRKVPSSSVQMLNVQGLPSEEGASTVALVNPARLVLTGTQVAFGFEDKDARLAFQRLQKSLEQSGVSTKDVVAAHYYPLASKIAAQIRAIRKEFWSPERPPASSLLLFEGLPSMNAGFAMDVVAAK